MESLNQGEAGLRIQGPGQEETWGKRLSIETRATVGQSALPGLEVSVGGTRNLQPWIKGEIENPKREEFRPKRAKVDCVS